jgi:hypothetical protein
MLRRIIPFGISTMLAIGIAIAAGAGDWSAALTLIVGLFMAIILVAAAIPLVFGGRPRRSERQHRNYDPAEGIITGGMVSGLEGAHNYGDEEPQPMHT